MTNAINCQQNLKIWQLQAWNKKDSVPCEELSSNPYLFLKKFKHAKKRLVEKIIELLLRYPNLYMRQDTIAEQVGICRSYCCTLLGELEKDGILVTWDRHKCSSFYKLSSFMLRQDVLYAASKVMAIFSGLLEQVYESTKKKLTLVYDKLYIKNLGTLADNVKCNNPGAKSLGNVLNSLFSPKEGGAGRQQGKVIKAFAPKLLPYKEELIDKIEKVLKLRENTQQLRSMSIEMLEHIVKNHPCMTKKE